MFATNGPAGTAYGPRVTISSPAQNQVLSSTAVNVFFTAVGATSVLCSLDGATAAPCGGSPVAYAGLAQGAHTIAITVSDGSLINTVVRSFSVNLAAPPATPPPAAGGGGGAPTPPVSSMALGKALPVPAGTAKLAITVSGAGALKLNGTAKLPKKGKLTVQAAGIGVATANAAGATQVTFKLNALAKKQLKAKGKLAVTVNVVFTPGAGTAVQAKTTIVFKAKKKKK